MIESAIEKEGHVSVVVPHGVLFRGSKEDKIRQKLIEENLLDAVIGLPGNLFPSTSMPVAILVFDRSREKGGARENCKDILFIDASRNYQPGKNQNILLDEHMKKILGAYDKRESQDKYAQLVSCNNLADNDFNLNIPRYVDTFEEQTEIDIKAIQKEIDTLEDELTEIRDKMANLLKDAAI